MSAAGALLERVDQLNEQYRSGLVRVNVPAALADRESPVDTLVEKHLPVSYAALQAASRGLFFSLPVAFNPAESVGPYLAAVDRDAAGEPYRFLDMGALIATQAFGENDPNIVRAVIESLPFVTTRYAHSEYQTVLSLRLKAALSRIAPAGTPRHFIVNTGAEAVENAIKSVLMNRVMTSPDGDGGFIVSFDGAFHGRTLGALAVTHRKKARLGFPTFDWPHIPFPVDEARSPKETVRREERSLKQLWDLLVSGRLPHAEKSKDTFKREMDAIDEFLTQMDEASSGSRGSSGSSGSEVLWFGWFERFEWFGCRRSRVHSGAAGQPGAGRGSPGEACRRGTRGTDSGRGRRSHGERAIHAQAAAPHQDLRRPPGLRRSPDGLGHDRPPVGS